MKRGEVISEKLDVKTINVPFTTEMLVSVSLNELKSGLRTSKFTAVLDTKDNKYKLDVSYFLFFNYFTKKINYNLCLIIL